MIKWRTTERGFTIGEFKDRYGVDCSIQGSSIATEECVWLGTLDRMHLTREAAGEIGQILIKFSETGELK